MGRKGGGRGPKRQSCLLLALRYLGADGVASIQVEDGRLNIKLKE